jgi:hypothetical protein
MTASSSRIGNSTSSRRGHDLAPRFARSGVLVALPDARLIAGDQIGRLHWLEIIT